MANDPWGVAGQTPTFHTETSNVKSTVVPYAQGTSSPPNGGDVTDVNNPEPNNAPSPQNNPWGVAATAPATSTSTSAPKSDEIQVDPHSGSPTNLMHVGGAFLEGIGENMFGTAAGLSDIYNKVTGSQPGVVNQRLHTLAGDNNQTHGAIQNLGRGAESIAEFLLGDEALKGLTEAEKYAHVAKTMKLAEKSPRMLDALKSAASTAAKEGARMGTVQGIQTGVKTGGDVGAAVKSGLFGGAVGGAFGGAGSLLGEGLSAAGNAGKKVQELGDVAEDAAPKKEVSQNLADTINQNKADLKSNYGETLRDFESRTKGTTVPFKDSPLHKTVQELLGEGKTDATPFDKAENISRPGSDKANKLLEGYADLAKEPEVSEPETWVDNNGVKHTEAATPAQPPEPVNFDMKTLLDRRRVIGERLRGIKGSSSEELADKQIYNKLLDGIDDTIDGLVKKADDPEIADEYQHLRGNYREHINSFEDPVIKKITDPRGAPDDAANAFLGRIKQSGVSSAGVAQRSLNTLQKTLDPMGTEGDAPLRQFGRHVFGAMLKDASPGGNFNASKFMETWGRIDPETKSRLFSVGNLPEGAQGPQTLLDSLSKDAKDARNIQRLVRIGLITAPSVMGMGLTHGVAQVGLGALGLLSIVNETSGAEKARTVLDFIANHPYTWKTLRAGGRLAESPITKELGSSAQKVATNAIGRDTEPDKHKE